MKNMMTSFIEPNCLAKVKEFHQLFKCPVLVRPTIPSTERCALRVSLLEEEVQELEDAIKDNNLIEIADALADIQYVLSGAVLEFGLGTKFCDIFMEVQRSNMSKACSSEDEAKETQRYYLEQYKSKNTQSYIEQISDTQWFVYRQGDHKALKSINYSPADLKPIILSSSNNDDGDNDNDDDNNVMPDSLIHVAAFHRLIQGPTLDVPTIPSQDRCVLRVNLLEEEVKELKDAIADNDLIEIADALADIQYVLSGAVHEFGFGTKFCQLFDEVHRSNMSKACKTSEEVKLTRQHYKENKQTESYSEKISDHQYLVYRNEDRKALKSINYSPANLRGIITNLN